MVLVKCFKFPNFYKHFIKQTIPVYFIDPKPSIQKNYFSNLTIIAEKASTGVEKLVTELID